MELQAKLLDLPLSLLGQFAQPDPEASPLYVPPTPPAVQPRTYDAIVTVLVLFSVLATLLPEMVQLGIILLDGGKLPDLNSFSIQVVGTRILGVAMLPVAACVHALRMATAAGEAGAAGAGEGAAAKAAAKRKALPPPGVTVAAFKQLSFAVMASIVSLIVTANGMLPLFSFGDGNEIGSLVLQVFVSLFCASIVYFVGKTWTVANAGGSLLAAARANLLSLLSPRATNLTAKLYSAASISWAMCVLIPALVFDFVGIVKGSSLWSQVAAGAASQALGSVMLCMAMALGVLKDAAAAGTLGAPVHVMLHRATLVLTGGMLWLYLGPFGSTLTISSVVAGCILCVLTGAAGFTGRTARSVKA